jgi:hypothetical protein
VVGAVLVAEPGADHAAATELLAGLARTGGLRNAIGTTIYSGTSDIQRKNHHCRARDYEMTSTLSHLLLQAADAHPDRPAIWSSTGELTLETKRNRNMFAM